MIPEIEVVELSENLTLDGVVEFFHQNENNLVYFHHVSDIPNLEVDTLYNFEKGELKIPTLANESGTFLVIHINKKVSQSLVSNKCKVGAIKVKKLVGLAKSLKSVNGIAVQCNTCFFTIGINELENGLGINA